MSQQESVTEYKVRIPQRQKNKNYHVMKFNASLRVDPAKWTQVRMVRENNKKEYQGPDEETPKYGAGSEFGREQREEARRKKYGIASKKYNPDLQPWLMRIGSKKEGRQYKGIREGGVAENTAYYIFTQAPDGYFEAHPIKEWYNFTPRVTYKTLNAEEAEEKYADRNKILNHWAVMVNKKLKPDKEPEDDAEEGEGKGKKGKGNKSFKISDMDDWVESGDEFESDEERNDDEDDDEGSKKKKRPKDTKKKKKKNKEDVDSEGREDSDDGDDEGREVDYMSDESSESEDDVMASVDTKGVDQDEGLAKMLDSDESEEEDEEKKNNEENEEEEEDDPDAPPKKKKPKSDNNSDDESPKKTSKNGGKGSKNASRSGTPGPEASETGSGAASEEKAKAEKRKALVESVLEGNPENAPKKSRLDAFASSSSSATNSVETAFEEDVRRYLARKPMTTTEILKKFKSKRKDLQKEELTALLVNVLKKINPHKQKVKGIMYLSLKTDQKKR